LRLSTYSAPFIGRDTASAVGDLSPWTSTDMLGPS
jgi:hypothetical protein